MLTGYAEQDAIDRIKQAGIVQHLLHKPWNPEDLRNAIDSAL